MLNIWSQVESFMVQKMTITLPIPLLLKVKETDNGKKSTFFKEPTPRSRTYELCDQGIKSIYKTKDKQKPGLSP